MNFNPSPRQSSSGGYYLVQMLCSDGVWRRANLDCENHPKSVELCQQQSGHFGVLSADDAIEWLEHARKDPNLNASDWRILTVYYSLTTEAKSEKFLREISKRAILDQKVRERAVLDQEIAALTDLPQRRRRTR